MVAGKVIGGTIAAFVVAIAGTLTVKKLRNASQDPELDADDQAFMEILPLVAVAGLIGLAATALGMRFTK